MIRILLLHPESAFVQTRAGNLLGVSELYTELIHRTIACIRIINNKHIELGFYMQEPVWNIIKTDHYTCIQSITPHRLSRNEHWNILSNNPNGLTDGFQTLFEKKWKERKDFTISKNSEKEIKKIIKQIKSKMQ